MSMARLIICDSESNADLYYAIGLVVPDSVIFVEVEGRRILIVNDLELDRAKSKAKVEEVISYRKIVERIKQRGVEEPKTVDVVCEFLNERSIKQLKVAANFGVAHADALRERGYAIEVICDPFFPERMVKSEGEVRLITQTLRVAEEALAKAIDLLHKSKIASDGTLLLDGKLVTSESLRRAIELVIFKRGCSAAHTIVACGPEAIDPHEEGSGAIKANQPIVIDVFPRHAVSRYFADIARTVVKGKAQDKVKRMFVAVKGAQQVAYRMVKDGVNGASVHKAILEFFESEGFRTGEQDGHIQGFFHGTGHGVGLEVHEQPRVSPRPSILKAGMVITIEPGLYYVDSGGMRLEDMVVVEQDGCRMLTEAPKVLEV